MLSNVLDEVIQLTSPVVGDRLLRVLGQPEESWESLKVNFLLALRFLSLPYTYLDIELRGHVVGCGVHLDNLNILGSHFLTQLVVDGSQLLAVAAPKSKQSKI